MIRIIIVLSFVAALNSSVDADTFVNYEMLSQHMDGRQGKNQTHHRYGIEHESIYFSTFKSSYGLRVWSVEKMDRRWMCFNQSLCLGQRYGLYKGYKFGDFDNIFPMWMPNLSYSKGSFLADVGCTVGVCAIELKYKAGMHVDNFIDNTFTGDLFVGIGYSWKADQPELNNYSLAYEVGSYRFELAHRGDYTRTPYYESNPEWRHILNKIESHNKISVTKRIVDYSINDNFKVYFDMGLSWVNRRSSVNSSRILFRESIGLMYKSFRWFFSHTSNAGIKGINIGEDAFNFEFNINF